MKKFFNRILIFAIYSLSYLSFINISASLINSSLETLTFYEIFSIEGMKAGQKDIYTFLELKLKEIDVEEMRTKILNELDTIN